MSEDNQNEPDQTESVDGSSPSTEPHTEPTAPTSSEPVEPKGSLKGAGLRYGEQDGVPDWAVGKTADEILQMTQTLYNSVLEGESTQQPSPQPTQPSQSYSQPQAQPNVNQHSQNGGVAPPDPDLIYTDKGEYQRQMEAYVRAQNAQAVQQASQPILKPLARMAREQSRSDPKYKDVWSRYGPEIDLAIKQNVPEQNRTDPDIWNQAAKLVAGEHWEELAQARAETVAAQPPDSGTVPAGGVTSGAPKSGGSGVDEIGKLFKDDHPAVRKFKRLGKTADDIRRHARTMGHTPSEYAEMLKNKESVSWTASGTPKSEEEAQHAVAVPAHGS